jgi:hypothetical protein
MLEKIIISAIGPSVVFFASQILAYFIKGRQEQKKRAEEIKDIQRQLEDIRQETREFYMLTLKCAVTNKEFSEQARLDAYDRYKKMGGNSWVDGYAIKFLKDTGN